MTVSRVWSVSSLLFLYSRVQFSFITLRRPIIYTLQQKTHAQTTWQWLKYDQNDTGWIDERAVATHSTYHSRGNNLTSHQHYSWLSFATPLSTSAALHHPHLLCRYSRSYRSFTLAVFTFDNSLLKPGKKVGACTLYTSQIISSLKCHLRVCAVQGQKGHGLNDTQGEAVEQTVMNADSEQTNDILVTNVFQKIELRQKITVLGHGCAF